MKLAKSIISQKSLDRRKKSMKTDHLLTYVDIPVNTDYINQSLPYIFKFRQQSRWLNAISGEVKVNDIPKLEALNFVEKIDIVRKWRSVHELNSIPANNQKDLNSKYDYNYGPSLTQLEQINVPAVHDMGYTGSGITICVLDAGFNNLEHQVFSTMNIADQWDFVNNDDNVDDEGDMGTGDHGTMTLSTIGGFYSGSLIGPAFGATYLLAKTENTDSETQIEEDNWVAGAEWADALGADITSTSLGYIDFDDGSGYSASELDGNTAIITIAADIAASLGILVVNSAGNEGDGVTTIGAPADGDSVLAVGAVYSDGDRTYFSSVGPTGDGRIKPDVMAMGSGVYVASPYGSTSYTTADGTSFSCPLTAGAAALLWQMVPGASNMEIFDALKMSANNAQTPNNQYGWGIIDIYAAYEYLALPRISHTPLNDTENLNGPYLVNVEVNSNYDLVAGSPILYYRRNAGEWNSIIMETSKETGNYYAEIPGNGTQAEYDYYITAENDNALVSLPSNAPSTLFTFNAAPDTQAPTIEHNAIAEYYINLWSQARIIAQLNDNIQIDITNSYVEWKINGIAQDNLSFIYSQDDIYTAYFPFMSVNIDDLIEYKIVAQDLSQAHNVTTFPASGFQSFNITDRISFEQNKFSHNWVFSGNAEWYVASDQYQHGSYSAKSGDISDDQSSSIEITFSNDVSGNVVFYKKVSSESSWDYLQFYIDNNLEDEWSGEMAWAQHSYTVSPGTHTLKWTYDKDGSVSSGSDCAWIDNITFPGVQQSYTVTFSVTDGTSPISNANVNFYSQNISTNVSGLAVFNNIPPGNNLSFAISKNGFETFNGSLSVTNQNVIQNVVLSQSTGIQTLIDSDVDIYPNPSSELLYIRSLEKIKEIHIFDVTGKPVKSFNGHHEVIRLYDLKPGVYGCSIVTNLGTITKKILIL
jgi:hypothetical protein